jgi:hypothetical protein
MDGAPGGVGPPGDPGPTGPTGPAGKDATDAVYIVTTLPASAWTGSAAPYSCTVANGIFTADDYFIAGPDESITSAQLSAAQGANIVLHTTTSGGAVFYAYGVKPTVDLPALITKIAADMLPGAPDSAGWQSQSAHYEL